ncbi:MAG: hypothetical protein GXP27_07385, partial [Planctomycetes bacterium]|nr:hypothetical protein [Planctomycetota bacterium]
MRAFAFALLLGAVLRAEPAMPAESSGRSQPKSESRRCPVVVHDVSGKKHNGWLLTFTDEALELLADSGSSRQWPLREVLQLQFVTRRGDRRLARTGTTEPPLVLLANGDRIRARAIAIRDERLVARWAAYRDSPLLTIPLETVRACLLRRSILSQRRPSVGAGFAEVAVPRADNADLIVLVNGDRMEGELSQWTEEELQIETAVGPATVAASRVVAVAMNPEWISFPDEPARRAILQLSDGSRVTVHKVTLADGD